MITQKYVENSPAYADVGGRYYYLFRLVHAHRCHGLHHFEVVAGVVGAFDLSNLILTIRTSA